MFGNKAEVMDSLSTLLNYEIDIFKSLDFLKILELKNMVKSSIYEDTLKELEFLSTKENRVLESISCSSDLLLECLGEIVKEIPNRVAQKSQEGLDLELIGEGVSKSALSLEMSEVTGRMTYLINAKKADLEFNKYSLSCSFEDGEFAVSIEQHGDIFKQPLENRIDLLRLLDLHDSLINETDKTKRRELIEEEFKRIYQSKFLTDELIRLDMRVDLLCDLSDEAEILQIMDGLDLDAEEKKEFLEEYLRRKEDKILEIVDSYLDSADEIEEYLEQRRKFAQGENIDDELFDPDFVTIAQLEEDGIVNTEDLKFHLIFDFGFLEKLLNMISTSSLTAYQVQLKMDNNFQSKDYVGQLIEIIDGILEAREDYIKPSDEVYDVEFGHVLPENIMDKYFGLLKLLHLIYKEHEEMCRLHLEGLKDSKEYKSCLRHLEQYLELEKSYLDQMDIFENIAEVFADILENNLDLIITDDMVLDGSVVTSVSEEEKSALKIRLQSLIPMLKGDVLDTDTSEQVIYSIELAHMQKVFKEFYNYIDSGIDAELFPQLIREMYMQSFYNSNITMDMVGSSFNPNNIVVMDDELSANLLNVSMREYCYDKDLRLYTNALLLLHCINDDLDDSARIIFNLICLKDLLNNISFEAVYSLQRMYQDIDVPKNEGVKTLQLRPLFKSVLPDYIEEE